MQFRSRRAHRPRRLLALAATLTVLCGLLPAGTVVPALASHTATPTSVTIAGSLQSELGCPGDWQPECATTHLTYDAADTIWQATFAVPQGSWEYKAALNDNWTESYGLNTGPDNIAVTVGDASATKFYYDHETHWATSNRNAAIATVAGSFQSEIGCPGDWQPDCLRSWLEDPDGNGVYEFQAGGLPVGGYEFKVARNEAWAVSYPADNVPFAIGAPTDVVTFTYNASTNAVTVDVASSDDAAIARHSLRNDLTDEVFYFVLPDRFDNGDPTNDEGGLSGDRLVTGLDPADKGFYHGGDIAGLLDRLDYIEDLGTTAIWMAPIFKNRPVQGSGANASAGYHGYWITDFTQIDPHFGSNAELETFVDAAHDRGIKVFFDIITNHTADVIDYEEGQYAYRNKADFPYLDADGVEFDDRDYAGTATFPALDLDSFPYSPVFRTTPDETVKAPAWLNDPIYYHNRGDSSFVGESSNYGDFFGLDDLFTEQPAVVDGMIDIYQTWVTEIGIDGYRIDTAKHVNMEFWQAFSPALQGHATSLGNDDFFMFGEVFDSNPSFMSQYTTEGTLQATLDFGFQARATAFAAFSSPTDQLRDLFADDDWYTDADSNAYSLPTFLGNHDIGRIGRSIVTAPGLSGDAEAVARDRLAHSLMYLVRGQPVVYYGDEQGFTGDGGDKDARQDMMPSQVGSYNDDDLIGTDATTAVANFDVDPSAVRSLRRPGRAQGRPPGAPARRPGPPLLDGRRRWRDLRLLADPRRRGHRVRRRPQQQRIREDPGHPDLRRVGRVQRDLRRDRDPDDRRCRAADGHRAAAVGGRLPGRRRAGRRYRRPRHRHRRARRRLRRRRPRPGRRDPRRRRVRRGDIRGQGRRRDRVVDHRHRRQRPVPGLLRRVRVRGRDAAAVQGGRPRPRRQPCLRHRDGRGRRGRAPGRRRRHARLRGRSLQPASR